ncbi:hypothetical protein [Maricaulis sp.]|uniref:hypothetical protein n=1 Tax=Maricaulis sp. TaxID=1486257 RepID=UPI0025C52554|nr:hypothetical protein [Maricaulis sp.]
MAALSITKGGEHGRATDHHEQSSSHAGENPSSAVQSPSRDISASETDENDPQAEIDRSERFWWFGDSIAQWLMTAGTMATVGLVAWTVLVTRKMLAAAEITAEAAIETVRVTRKIGRAQTRAYLSVVGARFELEYGLLHCIVRVKNFGNSPALQTTLSGVARVRKCDPVTGKREIGFVHCDGGGSLDRAHIQSGDETEICMSWFRHSVGFEAFKAIGQGEPVAFDLTLIWSDVFGKEHRLPFTAQDAENEFHTVEFQGWKHEPKRAALCRIEIGLNRDRAREDHDGV